ncbi:MAG TPA: NAD(P)/FAD-dependent oxidoreductase [Acidisphaera sp.]|nr:NAD(P)/FAD-dependent oxidoreductase [Acidisphaera sp.]
MVYGDATIEQAATADAGIRADREVEHFDVLVVGAGLSGIGAGYYLQSRCPWARYAILEAREAIGGTWDLFRYPGIRSDSDMFTLGYAFRPWTEAKSIADGPSILRYVRDTAAQYGIDTHIRFRHRVRSADWSSADARWTLEAERDTGNGPETVRFTCNYMLMASGYYSYAAGYDPQFTGMERFAGRIVHPQFWPEDLGYKGKRVVVIGSGATAVTIVPEMAKHAAHVTMLQRSPTYVVSRPSEDSIANRLRRHLPSRLAYGITRWKNVLLQMYFYRLARRKPAEVAHGIQALIRQELGPDYDVGTHFTPRYNPWDQRLCLVPDSDLFRAIRNGSVSVVTGTIETFTEKGLRLASGRELEVDIIVTATGLKLNLLGDVTLSVDGARADLSQAFVYKGMMFSGVPNLASIFGYTNASWTLKADLTCAYVCRMLNYMRRRGYAAATPTPKPGVQQAPFLDFTSGYVTRALAMLPKQGSRKPWKLHQNYALDMAALRFGRVDDPEMRFTRKPAPNPVPAAAPKPAKAAL